MSDQKIKIMSQRVALIREDECIGCTKCIQACPVDAILGAAQLMHTVVEDLCIGCDLCIAPCPVDCIDMISSDKKLNKEQEKEKAILAKKRAKFRKSRLQKLEQKKIEAQKKRIAEFNASPEASEIIKRAMEKAAAVRSSRTDEERIQNAINKLDSKLKKMKDQLKSAKTNNKPTKELERRIATWEQKIISEKEELKKRN